MMSGIRGKNTRPELLIRKGLHARGFRYRLHDRKLPGKPDLVFPGRKAVIFVNGCFWHGHDCHLFKWPASRPDFWQGKIEDNRRRDAEIRKRLQDVGWRSLVIWECAVKGKHRLDPETLLARTAAWIRGEEFENDIAGEIP